MFVSKALAATARNLEVAPDRGTNESSNARLWVYDRRLELMTRAFTLFGARTSSRRAPSRGHFSTSVPWSPVMLVDVVLPEPGGDTEGGVVEQGSPLRIVVGCGSFTSRATEAIPII